MGWVPKNAPAVICGAGIAGVSCAYHLAVKQGMSGLVIVEAGAPLSLTSDKSTECYRNWWPGPGDDVVRFMTRSIDLLEGYTRSSGDRFQMNRRGYLFATAEPATAGDYLRAGKEGALRGIGPLRQHPGPIPYEPHEIIGIGSSLDGTDLITDVDLIRKHFPYLSEETIAVLHVRRCGWLSAQQLGAYWLEEARNAGALLVTGEIVDMTVRDGIRSVIVHTDEGERRIETGVFVNAAGPHAKAVGELTGLELPLICERHVKVSIEDPTGAMGRDAPLVVWSDAIDLPWSEDERAALADDAETAGLLATFPAGAHGRPVGGPNAQTILLYWTYEQHIEEPVFPFDWNPHYPEIALRGMSVMLPALRAYFGNMPRPFVDGGYYTKTEENRPLIGPTPVPGVYLCAGFSGFGIMAAAAAGELLAAHVTGDLLPSFSNAFLLSRYDDPDYQALLADWPDSGQL